MTKKSKNHSFIGRKDEIAQLRDWRTNAGRGGACLTVIHGRRRIGKTRLVEESFRHVFKIEGIEGGNSATQQERFLRTLAGWGCRAAEKFEPAGESDWVEIFELLAAFLRSQSKRRKELVVFLDEFQWLASERTKLVTSFKHAWDNHLSKLPVHLIICGSVSSFIVKKVLYSRALYGRVDIEIKLRPLRITDIADVFRPSRSPRDIAELYMAVGGVPKYLELVQRTQSVRLNLERLAFSPNGYLVEEFERIFVSHFGHSPHYRKILATLARAPFATREKLNKACGLGPGGRISQYLEDLELAGFIERYAPVDKPESTRINRYRIADPYLLFYFRFIAPNLTKIRAARGKPSMPRFAPDKKLDVWRGLAFEHLCLEHADLIAERLGFGAVAYEVGPWFKKADDKPGAQVDLMFIRADRVITLCELKFRDAKNGKAVAREVERKRAAIPNPKRLTIETALITSSEPTADLRREGYFNHILTLDELLG